MAELIHRLGLVLHRLNVPFELIIVDDDSGDGTERVVSSLGRPWVRLITRIGQRGLSSAVLAGLRAARHENLVVMDADLSHPPEAIPALIAKLEEGAEFAVGSRYTAGGGTDERWSLWRAFNSRIATLMSRPLVRLRDPMSGFFALRRRTFERAAPLNPIGWKICLELLVKCHCDEPAEVPIRFATRRRGKSKLTFREAIEYVEHLTRLSRYRLSR